jgi:2-methylaconitate cis-trans-isomerase PrpF
LTIQLSVRIFNTNTHVVLEETIQVDDDGHYLEDGEYQISGVKGTGSSIKVSFLNPGGSMTGKVFPTGNRQDELLVRSDSLPEPFTVTATLIDVSNPFIFVDKNSMPSKYHANDPDSDVARDIIESIRRQGAVQFGLATDVESAGLRRGTPKIALVSEPHAQLSGSSISPDIRVLAYSMGKVHPSVQLTGAVCLGAAARIPGTVVAEAVSPRQPLAKLGLQELLTGVTPKLDAAVAPKATPIVIGHNSGTIDADVDLGPNQEVKSVTVFRTARRLFEGTILVPI